MSSSPLFNGPYCPFCNELLTAGWNVYFCSHGEKVKGEYHLLYYPQQKIIVSTHEYGSFHFTFDGNKITCVIFVDENSGERIWLSSDMDRCDTLNTIKVKDISVNSIPEIVERFEVRRVFK